MITRRDLEIAVENLLQSEPTYQTCARLADLYIILDHLKDPLSRIETDFLKAVSGKNVDNVFDVMNELMDATQVLNPRLYEATMMRVNEL